MIRIASELEIRKRMGYENTLRKREERLKAIENKLIAMGYCK